MVMQERQEVLEIFLFSIWKDVLMSHDDDQVFSNCLVTKQDVIQQVLQINTLKSANPSTLHLRTNTKKALELIMFILIN